LAHLRWHKGGDAELLALDGERLVVRSTVASAPGSRLEGTLSTGGAVRLKVHRCRRVEASFEIEGRLLDVTREARAELAALVPAAR